MKENVQMDIKINQITDDKQCIKTCDINSKNQFEFKKECFS